ncbi:hypothetical protein ACFP2F_05580 [Hymenobacter artigasi]|uniref:Uncharacterized protein n=1 Tax=Hymenobacter artigasi TaxID=2719616 RepID=A0ABX1HEM5_9BACT|nr:hypothetical protein [Hymenobacter artigasi]NKI88330.1 hypothetical protein [Hymenobacter artigasi]
MQKIDALSDLITVLSEYVDKTIDGAIHVHPPHTKSSPDVVQLSIDVGYGYDEFSGLLDKALFEQHKDAFDYAEPVFNGESGYYHGLSQRVVDELERREFAAARLRKLLALGGSASTPSNGAWSALES